MPHLIIIDEFGVPHTVEHDENGGNRQAPVATTWKALLAEDHAPSEIIIQKPSMQLAEKTLKLLKKFNK